MVFLNPLSGQESRDIHIKGEFINHPIVIFFDYLESQHNLKVFYKQEWVQDILIDQRFDSLLLEPALNRLLRGTKLGYGLFQDNSIILFPKETSDRYLGENYNDLLQVIGDPLNIGRYKNATISGKIVDGKNGEQLAGAVLYVPKLKKGTSTDSQGNFEIELPTGDHNLQLTFMGFEQSNRKIKLIESGSVEFEIFEETHNIKEITVRGEEVSTSKTQMSMIRIDSKALKEIPVLMGESDVIKAITSMAGIKTVSELSSGFNVRGGNTDQNLILVDGAPVFNTSHLFGFFSMLNPDVVENVLLYKGGLPVKFGERVSSVMKTEIKDGNDQAVGVYGGIGLLNSRLTIDGPLTKNKKLKFLLGGRTSYSDWILKKIPDTEISQSITKFYDISGKVTYDFNLHNKISLMAYSSNDEFSTSNQSVIKYGNFLGNLFLRSRLSEKLYSELNISNSRYKFRLTDLANNNSFESYYFDNQIQYSSLKYDLIWRPHPRHTFNFGLKGINVISDPGSISPVNTETTILPQKLQKEKALEMAGYISDEFDLFPGLSINLGLRYSGFANYGSKTIYIYDENYTKSPQTITDSLNFKNNEVSKSYSGVEPRISVNYDISPGISLKSSYQRTQQFYNQISNNAVISPAETWKFSDYHLNPLINDQIAIGISSDQFIPGIKMTTEIYYKKLQNLIEYKNGAEIIMNKHIETELIPSDGFSYGIEFSASKPEGRLTGMLNYVFARTLRQTNAVFDEEVINNGSWYPSIYDKPHDLFVTTTYHISRRWRISANFVFISGRPVTLPEIKYRYAGQTLIFYSDRNKYRMPPYHRCDFAITFDENLKQKRSWKGSWTLSIYNLYGRHNPYSIYYKKSIPSAGNSFNSYALYKLSVIGIPVPTLSYNFRF